MFVQVVGGLIVAVGLVLFVLDQRRPVSDDRADMKAWKIELGGPASLVLVVVGLAVLLFPYSPWWPGDPEPPAAVEDTLPTVDIGEPLVVYADPPEAPINWWLDWNEACGGTALYWEPGSVGADYWGIPIEVLDGDGNTVDSWWTESLEPFLCQWEWSYELPGFTYWLWPRGYNSAGEGDWIWIEVME